MNGDYAVFCSYAIVCGIILFAILLLLLVFAIIGIKSCCFSKKTYKYVPTFVVPKKVDVVGKVEPVKESKPIPPTLKPKKETKPSKPTAEPKKKLKPILKPKKETKPSEPVKKPITPKKKEDNESKFKEYKPEYKEDEHPPILKPKLVKKEEKVEDKNATVPAEQYNNVLKDIFTICKNYSEDLDRYKAISIFLKDHNIEFKNKTFASLFQYDKFYKFADIPVPISKFASVTRVQNGVSKSYNRLKPELEILETLLKTSGLKY